MNDQREEWYDAAAKVAVTIVDVTAAAQALARGHLSGPVAAHYLTQGLAAAALLGAETGEKDETVIVQMKCTGPLGGFNVECTAEGTLRGYTEKKTLDDFDGLGRPKDEQVLGSCQFQITRSVPGRILSQGLANSLNGYLVQSLQRRAVMALAAEVSDEVEILAARGVLVEALPDSELAKAEDGYRRLEAAVNGAKLTGASRTLLARLGYPHAELKKTTPLKFACRCSPDRAAAMLAALSLEERASLPDTIDITCHMCGRIFTLRTK